ncbi:MAG TPA: tRNA epoxyqueuosine(34) reductase QueG [Bacteroidales bacterium]|nr:tRNA epoxyqueuosine(34) reductase QueG [Bacteroidales bacterium]
MAASAEKSLSDLIRKRATELGFDLFGIARARKLAEAQSVLSRWCSEGMHDRMNYLLREPEKRANPEILFSGARSMVVTGLNYFTDKRQIHPDVPVISIYALGKDYHDIIKGRLELLLDYIKTIAPEAEGRAFCDDAPLLEKPWAAEAGLGWKGKHSIIINDKIGSFFFIGVLILNIDLEYNNQVQNDKCGSCSLCIDHCPTGAINNDRTIDARRCIANLTIGNRGSVPEEIIPLMDKRVYSCDICQDVCPWNKNAKPHNVPEFIISDELANMSKEEWLALDKDKFDSLFNGTPVERVKFERFKRNIEAVIGNVL